MSPCRTRLWLAVGLVAALALAPPLPAEELAEYGGGDRAQDLVVWISGPDVAGAGVVFAYDGRYAHVMTALHVARAQGQYRDDLKVAFRVWPGHVLPVAPDSLLGRPNLDFATFKVDLEPLGLPAAQIEKTLPLDLLGSSENLRPGDRVFTVGHTFAFQWLIPNEPVFFHSFTRMTPGGPKPEIIQVEYQCPPGHSGGALFDEQWRLVGVLLNTEGPFCWALRVEQALQVVREFGLDIDLYQRATPGENPTSFLPSEIKVAVMDFDNRSGADLPELGLAARDIISSFLVSLPRVVVLTRDRIDTVLKENKFHGTEKNVQQIARLGKLVDAEAILTGSVVRYDVERRQFSGFGTSALTDVYRMTISLLLIDVQTGRIRFAETFDVEESKSYPQASSAPRIPLSQESELLRKLLEQAREKLQRSLMEMGVGNEIPGRMVRVAVQTVPEGADVVIGGVWLGSTPTEIELSIGLHSIEISKPGYHPWRREVKVQPGTRVEINLTRQ